MDSQLRARQQAVELQDYMAQLLNWSKADAAAKKPKASEPRKLAPVRGSDPRAAAQPSAQPLAPSAPLAQPAPQGQGTAPRSAAAHTYDHYRDKWDKFDAEAPLADGGRAALPGAADTPPTSNTAEQWKERGNQEFKAGNYAAAVECYTSSVRQQPSCLAHANRAMALLKLGRATEAEPDCSRAIALDPLYAKAYLRRWELPAQAVAAASAGVPSCSGWLAAA
jgi:tetratricopeptide (TPR) repeat protein